MDKSNYHKLQLSQLKISLLKTLSANVMVREIGFLIQWIIIQFSGVFLSTRGKSFFPRVILQDYTSQTNLDGKDKSHINRWKMNKSNYHKHGGVKTPMKFTSITSIPIKKQSANVTVWEILDLVNQQSISWSFPDKRGTKFLPLSHLKSLYQSHL